MAWTNAGKVAIVPKGAWSISNTYERLDLVTNNNIMYIAKQDVPANTAITNTTYWQETITGQSTPIATTSVAGSVMPDGTTINVNASGQISVPNASTSVKGVMQVGYGLKVSNGAVSNPLGDLGQSYQAQSVDHIEELDLGWHIIDTDVVDENIGLFDELPISATDIYDSGTIGEAYLQITKDTVTGADDMFAKLIYRKLSDSSQSMWVLPCWEFGGGSYPTSSSWTKIGSGSGGGSNPNLLLNGWFTVNQRGVTSGTEGNTDHYLMDQWVGSRCNYSLGASGLTFAWDGVTQTNGYFKQQIEGDFSTEVGKPLTISAIVDGTLYTNTFILATSATDMTIVPGFAYSAYSDTTKNNNIIVHLKSTDTTSHTIKCVKLELGSTSTLALDELPPDYTMELLKCQRYFFRIGANSANAIVGFGVVTDAHAASVSFYIPVPLRATPTVTTGGTINLIKGTTEYSTNSINVVYRINNVVQIIAGTASTLTLDNVIRFRLTTIGAYIDLSAEL